MLKRAAEPALMSEGTACLRPGRTALRLHCTHSQQLGSRHVQARAWRGEHRWVALWAAMAALTLAHTATLVFALGYSPLSLACAALFAWVALLGGAGAVRGLMAGGASLPCDDARAARFASDLRVRALPDDCTCTC